MHTTQIGKYIGVKFHAAQPLLPDTVATAYEQDALWTLKWPLPNQGFQANAV